MAGSWWSRRTGPRKSVTVSMVTGATRSTMTWWTSFSLRCPGAKWGHWWRRSTASCLTTAGPPSLWVPNRPYCLCRGLNQLCSLCRVLNQLCCLCHVLNQLCSLCRVMNRPYCLCRVLNQSCCLSGVLNHFCCLCHVLNRHCCPWHRCSALACDKNMAATLRAFCAEYKVRSSD